MRIDPTNRPELQGPSQGDKTLPQSDRPGNLRNVPETGRPQTTEAACKSYIRKAADCQDVDLQAVAEARKLLDAGQLDTSEAIARAAENIVIRGI